MGAIMTSVMASQRMCSFLESFWHIARLMRANALSMCNFGNRSVTCKLDAYSLPQSIPQWVRRAEVTVDLPRSLELLVNCPLQGCRCAQHS
jgi:hypothetical protein